jgi:hypothetical protein
VSKTFLHCLAVVLQQHYPKEKGTPVIPVLRRARQEGREFKANCLFFFKFCLGNRASRWRLESLGHTVEVETCKGKGKGGNSSGIWKLKSKQE